MSYALEAKQIWLIGYIDTTTDHYSLKAQESRTSRSVSVLNDVDVPARNAQGFQGKLRECHHRQRGTARD